MTTRKKIDLSDPPSYLDNGSICLLGGSNEIRTHDFCYAYAGSMLYQLSYESS